MQENANPRTAIRPAVRGARFATSRASPRCAGDSASERLRLRELEGRAAVGDEGGELLQGRAGEQDKATPLSPMRVLGGEHRRRVVEEPWGPEPVALLASRRVVEQLVDDVVEALDDRGQVRCGLLEGIRRRRQLL